MKRTAITLSALMMASCATSSREAFDPSVDARIGDEIDRACFSTSGSGGYRRIGDRDAFLTGALREKYLLVFSRGCGDLGPGGSFPVFKNFGDNCRRQGEIVQTARADFGVTGGCTIEHIYEWDEEAEETEADDD
jgi:hypothetical protein